MINNDIAGDSGDGSSSNRNGDTHQRQNTSLMPKEMTYHYSGKVHVRGLLRRVWRPRYLALGEA